VAQPESADASKMAHARGFLDFMIFIPDFTVL
jgi:hypothetical protein